MENAVPAALDLSRDGVLRVLRSLLAAELATGGRRLTTEEAALWSPTLSLKEDGLDLDSLERLNCAAAVNALFRLHETGIEDYLLAAHDLGGLADIVLAGLAEGVSGVTFATSGSTGKRRPCPHAATVLAAEAAHWAGVFAGRRRVVAAVPAHHIYGFLFTVLLPERLGLPVLDARPLSPGRLRRELTADDLLIGFPTGYAAMLRSLGEAPLASGVLAVSSTAPLPADTHRALLRQGIERVIEVYGSSETGGIAARDSHDGPFRLLPRWRAGSAGSEASVIDGHGVEVRLPDRVDWVDACALRVVGRKDHAVQVGGINVFPEHVAERLRAHPAVADCAVRLDTSLPEPRLKAFVVPAAGMPPKQAAAVLEQWCRTTLGAAERPVRIDVGASLPQSELGKLADWSIAA